jgi:hypothetical protein
LATVAYLWGRVFLNVFYFLERQGAASSLEAVLQNDQEFYFLGGGLSGNLSLNLRRVISLEYEARRDFFFDLLTVFVKSE